MKIVYYSSIFFTDCDFSLIKEFQSRNIELQYYIKIIIGKQCGGLLDLRKYDFEPGIYSVKDIPEFVIYSDYIDLSNIYLIVCSDKLTDLRNWRTYKRLINNIYSFNPLKIHISNALGISEFFLYRFYKKMVMTVHDPFLHSGEYNYITELKRKLSFKLVPQLILLNTNQNKDFIEKYNINPKKIYFNRLGVYTTLPYIAEKFKGENANLIYYILFFGHISPYKGIDILCNAMLKVHKVYPDLQCIIAGNGSLYFDYKPFEKCDYIQLKNHYIDTIELARLIKNSLFIVCPYKDATQSGVIASSFAMSKIVVASNVGGLSESVIDNVTGVLVEPNNVESLADSIINLLNDKKSILNMENNIKNISEEGEISWKVIANKYINIYKQ